MKESKPSKKSNQPEPASTPISREELLNPHSNQPVINPVPVCVPEQEDSESDD